MSPRALLPAAALLAITLLALVPGCVRGPGLCDACGREIHASVRATMRVEGKGEVHACCPRCALHFRDESRARVSDIRVSDYASRAPLAIEDAWLVEGSDETPCVHGAPPAGEGGAPLHRCYDRCIPSLIPFGQESAARAFIEVHGGTLRPPGDVPAAAAAR
jgi:hypothetical protein